LLAKITVMTATIHFQPCYMSNVEMLFLALY